MNKKKRELMRKLMMALGLSAVSIPVLAESGLYVGVGAGLGSTTSNSTNGFMFADGASNKSGNTMAGAVYVGYDFSRFAGIQIDYAYLANVSYATGTNPQTGSQGNLSISQQVLDLGITGHLPFGLFANALSGLSIFGKLAVGYTTTSLNGGTVYSNGTQGSNYVSIPTNANSIVPVLGAGVEYGWNNVGIRAEYDYIGNTNVNSGSQTLMNVSNQLALVSVLYHF
jgi:hypothetical protein